MSSVRRPLRRSLRSICTALLALSLIMSLTAAASGSSGQADQGGKAHDAVKEANWKPCFDEISADFAGFPDFLGGVPSYSCATVKVPLDYDAPSKGVIDIDLVRIDANNPETKIGSLFLNPGGPGGSGIEFAMFGGPVLFGPEIRANFDIVGFDPRGVARGTAARCFGNARQQDAILTGLAFPITDAESEAWWASEEKFAAECDKRGSRVIGHMSTGNVARDLDRLREAVGDEKLTFYGISYGSMIGQTYANMFPENVRAVVIDGVLDPVAWTDGEPGQEHLPFSARLGSEIGAQQTLEEFFRLCDEAGPGACAFAPNAAERYRALAEAMADNIVSPWLLEVAPGAVIEIPMHYSDLIGMSLRAMYSSGQWPILAFDLAALEAQIVHGSSDPYVVWDPSGPPPDEGDEGKAPARLFPNYYNWLEAFPSVACADSVNPDSQDAWVDAAGSELPGDNYFRPLWTYASSVCAAYDAAADADRYAGPWDAHTENPILVMSTLFDPATPVHGAYIAHDTFPNSGLVLVDGWGHGALGISGCADYHRNHYLMTTELSFDDTVMCGQDFDPFGW